MAEGVSPRGRVLVSVAIVVALVFLFGRSLATLYTDYLWFGAAGFDNLFGTRIETTIIVRVLAALAAGLIIYLNLVLVMRRLGPVRLRRRYGNLEIAEQVPRGYVTTGSLLVSAFGGWWLAMLQFGDNVPLAVRAWLNHASWNLTDPLFGKDLSFYVFTLPVLLLAIDHILVALFWSMLLVAVGYSLVGAIRVQPQSIEIDPFARNHFSGVAAALLCMLALRFVIGRYALAVDGTGVQGAVGYTDIHARLLGHWVLAALSLFAAAALVYGARRSLTAPGLLGIGMLMIGGVIFGYAYPAVIQKLKVQPNQLGREQPYIAWNLEYTRLAFGLKDINRAHLAYETASPQTWAAASGTLDRLALWDVDQLQDGFNQVQSFQGYYNFSDVDQDRYMLPDGVQQVGVGVREFRADGLPPDSRSWFALHLRPEFTRGVGTVVARTDTAVGGQQQYLVGELAPIRISPRAGNVLNITEPSIYYGETTSDYIVVNDGSGGGVPIASFLRVIAFAWRFGDHNLLFAGNLDSNSRLLFRRNVRERAEEIAPFLQWDRDALPVVVDGRVQWVLDGYTVSTSFPMSSGRDVPALGLRSVNYMRGSVKATIDAVTGDTHLYATDAGDPILHSYSAVFPGLIRSAADMPQWLRDHLKYPATLLMLQADILEQYHVEQPNAFFAGQDAWEVPAQGASKGTPRPNEPLYLMFPMPGDTVSQFLSLLPFTARARQNLTAMIVVQNDAPNYGRLTLIDLAGDEQIKGPAQIQSLIEQDPEISQQLSLWRRMGTGVELGQLRIIPAGNSVLYVEPLYLAAEEKPIPQLHRVLVSDGQRVAMAESLEDAVFDLYGGAGGAQETGEATIPGTPGAAAATAPIGPTTPASRAGWPAEALRLYDQAEKQLRDGDFAGFGVSWQRLRTVLQNANADQRRP